MRSAGLAAALLLVLLATPPVEAGAPPRTSAVLAPPPGALEALNLSPTSRTVRPVAVQGTAGSVTNPQNVLTGQATRLSGTNSSITLDFGKEVGGIATLSFGATSGGQRAGLAFTESSLYIGRTSDASSGGNADGAIHGNASTNGTYTMPAARLRGGFRYLTVFLDTTGWVDLTGVSLAFTPAPGKPNPAAYANYFYSSDDLLNRIWYAGAYTVQTNIIASDQGRAWPPPSSEWDNSAVVGVGNSVLVDGAKRDRTVWPGDLGISVPTAYASMNELEATRNALSTMYGGQAANGEIPWSGPVFNLKGSDTYHTWTLLGTSLYYTYSADRAWLDSVWSNYTRGMQFILGKIDSGNLLNVTATQDWARAGQGGENIEANALLYAALTGGASLATVKGDSGLAATYANRAAALKAAANARLWDSGAGMYRDNPTSGLYPQDGNSLAVWYGLTDSPAKATSIVRTLAGRWNAFGATTPEWGGGVHPFSGGMEVQAHFAAGDDFTALAQIRRTWGHMLTSPVGTKSTFWEGINADGSPAYGGSFMSMAHGWSSGPTSALTFAVLGTAPETQAGQYRFVPHPGDLTSAEGRITLPQGPVNASWSRDPGAGTYTAHLGSPGGTTGRIGVPKLGGANISVSVNGAVVWSANTFTPRPGISAASQDGDYVYLTGVAPGTYDVTATGLGNPAPPLLPAAAGLPAGFTHCAAESGQCAFSGTRGVAYGAGTYTVKTATSATACTNDAFGTDPAADLAKSCYTWRHSAARPGTRPVRPRTAPVRSPGTAAPSPTARTGCSRTGCSAPGPRARTPSSATRSPTSRSRATSPRPDHPRAAGASARPRAAPVRPSAASRWRTAPSGTPPPRERSAAPTVPSAATRSRARRRRATRGTAAHPATRRRVRRKGPPAGSPDSGRSPTAPGERSSTARSPAERRARPRRSAPTRCRGSRSPVT